MKLKILPPTLRKNNRYLALDIKTDNVSLSKDELVSIIWEGCIHYCGECGTSDFNLWVMRFYDLDKVNHYRKAGSAGHPSGSPLGCRVNRFRLRKPGTMQRH